VVLWFNNELQKTGLIELLIQSEENIKKFALFDASAAKQIRTAFFWVITPRVMVSLAKFRDNLSGPSSRVKGQNFLGHSR